jgi:pilus assembly protein Flp/PilA
VATYYNATLIRGGFVNSPLISMIKLLGLLIKREDGQDLVEYGLVVALIAFGAILGLKHLGGMMSILYSGISSVIQTSM